MADAAAPAATRRIPRHRQVVLGLALVVAVVAAVVAAVAATVAAAVAPASVVVVRPTATHAVAGWRVASVAGRAGSLGGLGKGFSKLAGARTTLSCHLIGLRWSRVLAGVSDSFKARAGSARETGARSVDCVA